MAKRAYPSTVIPSGYDCSTPYGAACEFWFNNLLAKAASLFKWTGLPPSVNPYYLTAMTLTDGWIVWTRDKLGHVRALRGSVFNPDCYGKPTEFLIANHVPSCNGLKGKLGVDGVLMYANRNAESIVPLVKKYAEQLARLDTDIRINLDNVAVARVFPVENDAQAQKIRRMYDDLQRGLPAVLIEGDFMREMEELQPVLTPTEYLVPAMLKDRRMIINDFLSQIGVDNCAVEKAERLVSAEVSANNAEIDLNRAYFDTALQNSVDEVNKMFGTSISFDYIGKETAYAEPRVTTVE